jgi:hypothetical protein
LFTNTKMAFSGESLIRLRMTYTNCPTVRSAGTKYFFLSRSGMSLFSAFSTMTCEAGGEGVSRAVRAEETNFANRVSTKRRETTTKNRPRVLHRPPLNVRLEPRAV